LRLRNRTMGREWAYGVRRQQLIARSQTSHQVRPVRLKAAAYATCKTLAKWCRTLPARIKTAVILGAHPGVESEVDGAEMIASEESAWKTCRAEFIARHQVEQSALVAEIEAEQHQRYGR
jgi:hypothetical protein